LENWIYNNVRNIYENNIILTTNTGSTGWGGKLDFTKEVYLITEMEMIKLKYKN
jgi:hypothetical protein